MPLFANVSAAGSVDFHGGARLVSSRRAVVPGESFEVAVRIDMDPGWHTYWQNPGDAGIPPKITWRLPSGWTVGAIQWPVPHKLIAPEIVSYGYEREALLLVKLTAPRSSKIGSAVPLRAKVDWLVCQEGCIPATALVNNLVRISTASRPDPVWSLKIREAERRLPPPPNGGSVSATLAGANIVLSFPNKWRGSSDSVTFYPADSVVEPSAPQALATSGMRSTLTLKISQFAPSSMPRLRGLLVSQRAATTSSHTIDVPLRRKNP